MIYLSLFLTFLEIGAFTFGGGLAMVALIREKALTFGWLTEEELLDFVAVSESTPGPLAINMATFVGASQGGFLGAFAATLGVVLPSFLIILLIAALASRFLSSPPVAAALGGVRPTIVALILSTGITILLSSLFGFSHLGDAVVPNVPSLCLFAGCFALDFGLSRFGKKLPPVFLILICAVVGMILFH